MAPGSGLLRGYRWVSIPRAAVKVDVDPSGKAAALRARRADFEKALPILVTRLSAARRWLVLHPHDDGAYNAITELKASVRWTRAALSRGLEAAAQRLEADSEIALDRAWKQARAARDRAVVELRERWSRARTSGKAASSLA